MVQHLVVTDLKYIHMSSALSIHCIMMYILATGRINFGKVLVTWLWWLEVPHLQWTDPIQYLGGTVIRKKKKGSSPPSIVTKHHLNWRSLCFVMVWRNQNTVLQFSYTITKSWRGWVVRELGVTKFSCLQQNRTHMRYCVPTWKILSHCFPTAS